MSIGVWMIEGATMSACDRQCNSQCDNCHTLDNCVEATRQYGDLLLCQSCREKYPVRQPWRLDPETGEYIDNYTVGNYVIDNPGPVAVGDVELDWGPVFASPLP